MRIAALFFVVTATTCFALGPATVETSTQARVSFDSNPEGSGGATATVYGGEGTLIYSAAVALTMNVPELSPTSALKLAYTGELYRFDRYTTENYSSHRFGITGRFFAGGWAWSGDGSALLVDGSRDTLVSMPGVNANAITLWRERRAQWQFRARFQGQAEYGATIVRASGSFLAYDYLTKVVAGKFAFANRSDRQGGFDAGWKQSTNTLLLAGVRLGRQSQAIVPLPNCDFDYSNDYLRVAGTLETKPFAGTVVSISAGPNFRRYTGMVDPRVFPGGRSRTSAWYEAGATTVLSSVVNLTGKATMLDWLSSTGKSALRDTSTELAILWAAKPNVNLRVTGKLHRCKYDPVIRDDEESLWGAGVTYQVSRRMAFSLDLMDNRAWNNNSSFAERKFDRVAGSVGASYKF